MNPIEGINTGLGGLHILQNAQTRSICAENPTGEKGKAAMAMPDVGNPDVPHCASVAHLGQGWKIRPFLQCKAGQTVTLMDVDGPGTIQHIWLVNGSMGVHGRSNIIRFYWDGEEKPSIEVPVTDFFAVGHDIYANVNSVPVVVKRANAFNCYWPMPFRKHVKVTITNESPHDNGLIAYQITYAVGEVPADAAYLHAQYRRANGKDANPVVILDGVKGRGHYVGTFMAVSQTVDRWFGEGEIMFFMDGDKQFPTICGTGTEDYFLCSYGFPEAHTTAFSGVPLAHCAVDASGRSFTKWSLYRWHVLDPIHFKQDLKVTIQDLVWGPEGGKMAKGDDDFATVAYWYQTEPHAAFPMLPSAEVRCKDIHLAPGK
ncbi:MAG: DUF2961 domain-containing protein [Planctomycetaceae bacterium]|nr:DUF2961 domain-containing protein [Planctomycetaceae bacterium]